MTDIQTTQPSQPSQTANVTEVTEEQIIEWAKKSRPLLYNAGYPLPVLRRLYYYEYGLNDQRNNDNIVTVKELENDKRIQNGDRIMLTNVLILSAKREITKKQRMNIIRLKITDETNVNGIDAIWFESSKQFPISDNIINKAYGGEVLFTVEGNIKYYNSKMCLFLNSIREQPGVFDRVTKQYAGTNQSSTSNELTSKNTEKYNKIRDIVTDFITIFGEMPTTAVDLKLLIEALSTHGITEQELFEVYNIKSRVNNKVVLEYKLQNQN